ncbi:MAG: hypothetical protein VX891_05205 [Candidatus Thermoplasmatota archaeon]|nr:hypothetical protein [Candidatus Thermoplasmatota archaeon]
MGHLEGLKADRLEVLMVARKVVQMADRLEDLKVARTVVQMAVLTEARTVDLQEGRRAVLTEAQTADRSWGLKEEQMEEWAEGLAPRQQERVSAVVQVRSQAPLASA